MDTNSSHVNRKTVQEIFDRKPSVLAEETGFTLVREGTASVTGLRIFKDPCDMKDPSPKCPMKGLIIDSEDYILAPGVKIPLSSDDFTDEELEKMILDPNVTVANAVDGTTVRIYNDRTGTIQVSSNGQITPIKGWGPVGAPSILDLLIQVIDQFDEAQLNRDYCYYFRLSHTDLCSFSRPVENKLTLMYVIDCRTLDHVDIYTPEFDHFRYRAAEPLGGDIASRQELKEFLFSVPDAPAPVDPAKFGVVLTLPSGSIVRLVNKNCQNALDLLPNVPDPAHHWIHLLDSTPDAPASTPDAPASTTDAQSLVDVMAKLEWRATSYLAYFPWRQPQFQQIKQWFLHLVMDLKNDIKMGRAGPDRRNYIDKVMGSLGSDPSMGQLTRHLAREDPTRIIYLMKTVYPPN